MKLRVKELCKERGLKMGQLAEKMGVELSNLSASINGNPTLDRLKDIAKNLGVEVYELFQKPSETSGMVALAEINGETYKITTASEWAEVSTKIPGLAAIPYYGKDSDLLKEIVCFIKEGVKTKTTASLTGQFLGKEVFCLSRRMDKEYDFSEMKNLEDIIFLLTLFSSKRTIEYSLLEFCTSSGYDIDGDTGMAMAIRNEIESFMDSTESAME